MYQILIHWGCYYLMECSRVPPKTVKSYEIGCSMIWCLDRLDVFKQIIGLIWISFYKGKWKWALKLFTLHGTHVTACSSLSLCPDHGIIDNWQTSHDIHQNLTQNRMSKSSHLRQGVILELLSTNNFTFYTACLLLKCTVQPHSYFKMYSTASFLL